MVLVAQRDRLQMGRPPAGASSSPRVVDRGRSLTKA